MSLLRAVGETSTRISLAGTTTTVFGGTGHLGPSLVGKLGQFFLVSHLPQPSVELAQGQAALVFGFRISNF